MWPGRHRLICRHSKPRGCATGGWRAAACERHADERGSGAGGSAVPGHFPGGAAAADQAHEQPDSTAGEVGRGQGDAATQQRDQPRPAGASGNKQAGAAGSDASHAAHVESFALGEASAPAWVVTASAKLCTACRVSDTSCAHFLFGTPEAALAAFWMPWVWAANVLRCMPGICNSS